MNKQELIERYLKMVKLKDIIKRINELEHSAKQYWIDEILKELGSDYGRLKYRSGYEQGKLEGMVEREKVIVPQCVAEWIKYCKCTGVNLYNALDMGDLYFYNYSNQKDDLKLKEFFETDTNQELFARAWLDGYEVEKEKRYLVMVAGLDSVNGYLCYNKNLDKWFFGIANESKIYRAHHTRKELEQANFGWVFDCPGIDVEEVEG